MLPTPRSGVDRLIAEAYLEREMLDAIRSGDRTSAEFLSAQPFGALLPRDRDSFPPRDS